MKPLGIYHGSCCFDGFGAAWVLRRYFGEENIDLYPATYGETPPDVTARDVIMVDFSYKRDVLEQLVEACDTMVILDHHKTAQEDLAEFPSVNDYATFCDREEAVMTLFDMNRSGAGITWDFFFPDKERPPLINYVEDRDLWRFALPKSREVHAGLSSYPFDFDVWDDFMLQHGTDILLDDGVAIDRKHNLDVEKLVKATARFMVIGGFKVPVANVPMTMCSDAGHLLSSQRVELPDGQMHLAYPFAASYWDTENGRAFSLRSNVDGVDVSEVAKQYGGGGHRSAAGFHVPFEDLEILGLL